MKKSQETSSVAICRSKDEARNLLEVFNPEKQTFYAVNPTQCVMGDYPTLAKIKAEYGEQFVYDWLAVHLNDYQNFVGVKEENKASYRTIKEVARMIYNRYYYLKITELMLFFQRLKYGDYGEMYGCIDAVRIMRALRTFFDERNQIIEKIEQRERERKMEEDRKNAVSYEEYTEIKKRKNNHKVAG